MALMTGQQYIESIRAMHPLSLIHIYHRRYAGRFGH